MEEEEVDDDDAVVIRDQSPCGNGWHRKIKSRKECSLFNFKLRISVLTGLQGNAEFALAMCPIEPFVLSRGKDKFVVFGSIQDHISTLAEILPKSPGNLSGEQSTKFGVLNRQGPKSPTVGPWSVFQGHEEMCCSALPGNNTAINWSSHVI